MFHADGQTDRYDEANSHFSQFCVCAYEARITSTKVHCSLPTVRSHFHGSPTFRSTFRWLVVTFLLNCTRETVALRLVSRDGRAAKPKFPLMCLQSQLSCKTLVLATCCLCGIRPYHIRRFAKLSEIPPLLESVWTKKKRISLEEIGLFNNELPCSGGVNGTNKHSQMFVTTWYSIHSYLLAG